MSSIANWKFLLIYPSNVRVYKFDIITYLYLTMHLKMMITLVKEIWKI